MKLGVDVHTPVREAVRAAVRERCRAPSFVCGVVVVVVVVVVVSAATGCPQPAIEPVGDPDPPAGCGSDRDCGGGAVCDKTNDGDDVPAAADALGVCVSNECGLSRDPCACRLICEPPRLCDPRDDDACSRADERCLWDDGAATCRAPDPRARCELVLPPVAHDGDDVEVGVLAFDAAGQLIAADPFTVRAVCAAGTCAQTVDAGCGPHKLTVLAPLTSGHRVVVVDDAGAALAGVDVFFDREDDSVVVATDAAGVAIAADADVVDAVALAPDGHEAHTLVDPPRDLVVVTRRDPGRRTGVFVAPDFQKVHSKGDMPLSLSGLPLSRDLSRFSLADLVGGPSDVVVDVEGLTDGPTVTPLPDNATWRLGDDHVFRDRALVTSSTAAPRLFVWTIGLQVQLSQIGGIVSQHPGELVGADTLFAIFGGPFGAKADHGFVVVDAPAARVVRAAADADLNGAPDAPPTSLTPLPTTTTTPSTLLALSDEVPAWRSGAPSLLSLVVVDVPGAGLVPLGFGEQNELTVGDNGGGIVDFAAPHDGLEGCATTTWTARYAARPLDDRAPIELTSDGEFVAAAVVAIDDVARAVHVEDVGADVAHVRVVDDRGHAWNLWTQRPVDVALPLVGAASVTSCAFGDRDGAGADGERADVDLAFDADGGLRGVVALTRVPVGP